MRRLSCLALAVSLAACATDALPPRSPASTAAAPEMQVAPPYGFIAWCLRDRAACTGGTDRPVTIALTPAKWAELDNVNVWVNAYPQVDHLGVDVWHEATASWGWVARWRPASERFGGNCADLAVAKRQLLIAGGWPPSALLLTMALRWNGEGHTFLTVVTDRGDYALDNLSAQILPISAVPYVLVARQSRKRPFIWIDLTGKASKAPAAFPPLGAPIPFIAVVDGASKARAK